MEKNTKFWETARDKAISGCARLWPEIQRTKKYLIQLELTHGEHEVRRLEAERHLVEVIKVGRKHKTLDLVETIAKLSPKQRIRLVEVLDKAIRIEEKQDHV